MPELTPLDDNRQEHFLNGEDLEPITRREHFYAGRESELPAGHQEPETREEWFIQKYRGGGGDVTVVPLSVIENGTYSEEGKAYSPVNVNVPLPQNAYLLKSVANLPQAIASFNDGADAPMKSLKVAIEPQQDLSHGEPSPTNICPISGWDEVNMVDDAVYGGYINWNQLAKELTSSNYEATGNATATFSNGIATISASGQFGRIRPKSASNPTIKGNHVYIFSVSCKTNYTHNYYPILIDLGGVSESIKSNGTNNTWENYEKVIKTSTNAFNYIYYGDVSSYYMSGDDTDVKNIQLIDLTQIFGETKANEIYTMEQAEAGSGVAYFKSLFYKDYYSYNSGEITNVSAVNGDTDRYRTYTIDLDGTRYGGEVDVVNGIVTPVPYYASYNGEALTGEWISDRDKYEVGATPTIGAQVVNIGASGTPVSILPTAIKSLRGVNNVWADTGDITDAEYFSKEV